jgi:ADP-ribose pyrophosphatase
MKNKTVFKGRLIDLVVRKVRLPNGYLARLETIKHPGAALIVPFVSKDKIILLKQYRPVINSYIYELPAGTLDKGEKPLECAKREIVEETGFSAKRFTYLGKIFPVPGYSTECIYIYRAEGLRKEERRAEADEVIEARVFTRQKVCRLFKAGKIVDAKTIAAFAMCGWL